MVNSILSIVSKLNLYMYDLQPNRTYARCHIRADARVKFANAQYRTHPRFTPSFPFRVGTQERSYCDRHIQSKLSLPGLYNILLPYNQRYHPPRSLFTALVPLLPLPPRPPPLAFIPHAILKPRQLAVGVVARDGEGVRQFQPGFVVSSTWWGCLGYDWLSAGVNPWARPHPSISQSTPANPAGRAFHPEFVENEGENVSGKNIPDISEAQDKSSPLSLKEIISDR